MYAIIPLVMQAWYVLDTVQHAATEGMYIHIEATHPLDPRIYTVRSLLLQIRIAVPCLYIASETKAMGRTRQETTAPDWRRRHC